MFELPLQEPSACPLSALAAIKALHQRCQDLPVSWVTEVFHLKGEPPRADPFPDHPAWCLWDMAGEMRVTHGDHRIGVPAIEVIGFMMLPAEGSETVEFCLARHASTAWDGRRRFKTGLDGWRGRGFCKTQYASVTSEANFMNAHKAVIAALDEAHRLGFLVSARDEGKFLDFRSDAALRAELNSWNRMIAALGGALKDAGSDVVAPICEHPRFEHLEAEGLEDPSVRTMAAILSPQPAISSQNP